MIVSRIKCYRWTLRSCTLTCSCLRDATIEHFFSTRLSVTEIVSVNNLPSFLQANPAIWDRTPELFLSGQTFRNNVYRFVPLANLDATVLLDFYRCCQISRPCILGAWFIVSRVSRGCEGECLRTVPPQIAFVRFVVLLAHDGRLRDPAPQILNFGLILHPLPVLD